MLTLTLLSIVPELDDAPCSSSSAVRSTIVTSVRAFEVADETALRLRINFTGVGEESDAKGVVTLLVCTLFETSFC